LKNPHHFPAAKSLWWIYKNRPIVLLPSLCGGKVQTSIYTQSTIFKVWPTKCQLSDSENLTIFPLPSLCGEGGRAASVIGECGGSKLTGDDWIRAMHSSRVWMNMSHVGWTREETSSSFWWGININIKYMYSVIKPLLIYFRTCTWLKVQTDGWTEGQTDGWTRPNLYTHSFFRVGA